MSGNENIKESNKKNIEEISHETTSQSSEEAIHIKSAAASNGLTTILIGCFVAFIGMLVISFLPELFFLVGILFLSGSIIAFVMGFFKLKEPKFSLCISKSSIKYTHRKGEWEIPWENLQRVDVPRIYKDLAHVDLEMVGFKLRDSEKMLSSISPRLITHLLMEQRPLITQIASSNCESGQCYGDDLIEDTKYKMSDGSIITGVHAMFANRMKRLQQALGYDLYLSVNDIDRSNTEFVQLIKECQESLLHKYHKD